MTKKPKKTTLTVISMLQQKGKTNDNQPCKNRQQKQNREQLKRDRKQTKTIILKTV
jgi:hypothetical protein